jgi:polyhydroxyalkanoate synthesis repressor PhaR
LSLIQSESTILSELRVIKKYPNRRLYDTVQSKYITLADLKKLIADGIDIEVQDANSGADLTRSILLQIINDQESSGQPLFTTEILTRMIRFYGDQSQDMFTDFLSSSLNMYVEQQQSYQSQITDLMGASPMNAFTDMAKQNMEMWADMQRTMMGKNKTSDK